MAEVFFKYDNSPYMYDTRRLKLFQMKKDRLSEIVEPKTLNNIRFKSIEIRKEMALCLAQTKLN